MNLIRKAFEIKAADAHMGADDPTGRLIGAANVMGILDQSNDVIFPGVYIPVLQAFLRDGFVALNHDWDDLPIAMPAVAEERGMQLYTEAVFHSTPDAQAVRTIVQERLAANLSVGLSVGFITGMDQMIGFQNGATLLAFAAANGFNLALFDVPGIQACMDWCWGIIGIERLLEYSVTPLPCNLQSLVSGIKTGNGGTDAGREMRETAKQKAIATQIQGAVGDQKQRVIAYRALEARAVGVRI